MPRTSRRIPRNASSRGFTVHPQMPPTPDELTTHQEATVPTARFVVQHVQLGANGLVARPVVVDTVNEPPTIISHHIKTDVAQRKADELNARIDELHAPAEAKAVEAKIARLSLTPDERKAQRQAARKARRLARKAQAGLSPIARRGFADRDSQPMGIGSVTIDEQQLITLIQAAKEYVARDKAATGTYRRSVRQAIEHAEAQLVS
jgi:hypothetical protein